MGQQGYAVPGKVDTGRFFWAHWSAILALLMTPGQGEPSQQSVFWPPHTHTCVRIHQHTKDRPEN